METPKHIKEGIKNSVGYSEAEDRNAFMVGASVAFSRAEEFFTGEIDTLTQQLNHYKNAYENVYSDIRTVTKIINKYSDRD